MKSKRIRNYPRLKKRKKNRYLIIDGYNFINARADLKNISDVSLEESREKLIDIVTEYSEFTGYQSVIVFDAYRVKGVTEITEERGSTIIVYTKESQTADSYIEKFVSELHRFDEVFVVTDDSAEQQIALGKGAVRISTREFNQDIDSAFKKISERTEISHSDKINRIENNVSLDVLVKLEKIRRRKD